MLAQSTTQHLQVDLKLSAKQLNTQGFLRHTANSKGENACVNVQNGKFPVKEISQQP